ncbi:hypothetical protein FA95DRAFT_545883 [Auriscalpium vulgare]|uniref:Uncharacterized protein n=1 Tax=Auriscalpium vulgare TaxID=40419 RepID=A0ACB8REI2_9AGAM|nr:hypothetical protein FA95DRAFT_545883 [Auriscalpium vulgare]
MKTSWSKPSGLRLPSTRKFKGLRVRIATGAMARSPSAGPIRLTRRMFLELAPPTERTHVSKAVGGEFRRGVLRRTEFWAVRLSGSAARPPDPYGVLRDVGRNPRSARQLMRTGGPSPMTILTLGIYWRGLSSERKAGPPMNWPASTVGTDEFREHSSRPAGLANLRAFCSTTQTPKNPCDDREPWMLSIGSFHYEGSHGLDSPGRPVDMAFHRTVR